MPSEPESYQIGCLNFYRGKKRQAGNAESLIQGHGYS